MLNSLLALLNSRDMMRNKLAGDDPVAIHLSRLPTKMSSMPTNTLEFCSAQNCSTDTNKEVRAERCDCRRLLMSPFAQFVEIGQNSMVHKGYA